MTPRERFDATMHYKPVDRSVIMDFGFWEETPVIWREQGLPEDTGDLSEFLGMDPQWIESPTEICLWPWFEHEVLEDKGETQIIRDREGCVVECAKFLGSIPHHISNTLRDRETWEKDVKWRLDGTAPTRNGAAVQEWIKQHNTPGRDYPVDLPAGSLYGWIRNWMGLEGVSMIVYDDPALFEEMVETVCNCIIAATTPVLESGIQFSFASMWEDMSYRNGPLLSPRMFAKFLVPQYKRLVAHLNKYGIDIIVVDSDGDISHLAPLWLEAGINTMFPLEVGVWGTDPVKIRKEYGKDCRMMGGVGKLILASTREAITAEVERLAPLVEEGGYIPTPDHRVPPDVSLDNYLFYLEESRRVWGRDLPNLRPMSMRSAGSAQGI